MDKKIIWGNKHTEEPITKANMEEKMLSLINGE